MRIIRPVVGTLGMYLCGFLDRLPSWKERRWIYGDWGCAHGLAAWSVEFGWPTDKRTIERNTNE